MLSKVVVPDPVPARKVPGYEMPDHSNNLLAWEFVAGQMANAQFYWLSTLYADGRPHVTPLWAIWYENRVHFDGSPKTGWLANLLRNPYVAVHLPDADKVVIIEGIARTIEDDELSRDEWQILDQTYQQKYRVERGSPYVMLEPRKVLAWNGANLHTMTRWIFPKDRSLPSEAL